ncbi:MAG TPA: multicopper oxidase domain-containing protein [Bryobacteraceae bacterium]|jgi:spore coat protein A
MALEKVTPKLSPSPSVLPSFAFEGFTGRYVWHCHMLEHEDNEMMRPYEVVPA